MSRYLPPVFSLFLAFCFQVSAFSLQAQQTVFIPSGGQIFAHPADSVGIFGNVVNHGSFGTAPGSVVNFQGSRWQNAPLSALPGITGKHTPGGLFRFLGTHSQMLAGGYNLNGKAGPSFPNMSIENASGVQLEDLNDLSIRGNLHFGNGDLFLNGWNALVNDSITGYSSNGFVVTGTNIGGGRLYRKPYRGNSADQELVFPIGTATDSYSPLAVKGGQPYSGMVGARVFDHVYRHAMDDAIIDSDYVQKTWQLVAAQSGGEQTTVLLQHREADQGVRFSPFRDSSYISRYSFVAGQWDMDTLPHSVLNSGMLTTGRPRNNTYLNDRTFPAGLPVESTDSVSWLSISTVPYSNITCPVADFKLWVAQRYNYRWVQLFWRTLRELNVQAYAVQRRRDTSTVYRTIATFDSKGKGGFSDHLLYYYYADDNTYDGWSYYRLKMTSASGCVVYTKVQEVSWGIGIEVWPNPSPGESHVRVMGIKHPITMQVVDTWGQVLRRYTINADGILDIKGLSDAAYFLVFYDPKNNHRKIRTVKLIVQHRR